MMQCICEGYIYFILFGPTGDICKFLMSIGLLKVIRLTIGSEYTLYSECLNMNL